MKIKWKDVPILSIEGNIVMSAPAGDWDSLLAKIEAMPPGKPITYQQAVAMAWQDLYDCVHGAPWRSPPAANDIAAFAASLGYKIILTGDEYEIEEEV